MKIGLHVVSFSWPDSPVSIAPTLAGIASAAEESGICFQGKHYALAETICEPRPIQTPRPPVMIGGSGERKTLRLVARYADSCNLFEFEPSEMARKLEVLRRHCDDEARDFDSIEKTMLSHADAFADPEAFVAHMRVYADLGIDTVIVVPSGDPVEFTRRLADTGARLQDL